MDAAPPPDNALQTGPDGRLRHFLDIDGLGRTQLLDLLDRAETFLGPDRKSLVKTDLLAGKTVANLFFEASTRTRTTFEIAAKRLSADVINLNIGHSATVKGESLLDTVHNLQAMNCDIFVLRHRHSGAAHLLAAHVADGVSVINAGDGRHAHPTQALLDVCTIRRHKPDFGALTVTLVGDILHSRVARSELHALRRLGAGRLRVCAPRTLLPVGLEDWGVEVHTDLDRALADADVVIALRLQKERMAGALLPSEREYFRHWGLTPERLARAKPDVLVMHPGPINRGVEIDSRVADGPHSLILEQVTTGIAVRMAVMATLQAPDRR